MTLDQDRWATKILVACVSADVVFFSHLWGMFFVAGLFAVTFVVGYIAFLCWVVTLPDPSDVEALKERRRR
jgi:hypothetical protein